MFNCQEFPHYRWMQAKKLVYEIKIRIRTWNICTLPDELIELLDILTHKKINSLCISKTKVDKNIKEINSLSFETLVFL